MARGFSWKRASGVSGLKGRVSRKIKVPLTKSGRRKKVDRLTRGATRAVRASRGCALGLVGLIGVVAAACVLGPALAYAAPATKPAVLQPLRLKAAAPPDVRQAVAASDRLKEAALHDAPKLIDAETTRLRRIERGTIDRAGSKGRSVEGGMEVYRFTSPEQRREAIKKQAARLAQLRAVIESIKTDPAATLYEQGVAEDFRVGFIGRFPEAKVLQVLDAEKAIVELHAYSDKADSSLQTLTTVTVMLEGFATSGVTDGAWLPLSDKPLRFVSTTTYKTVIGGTRTVLRAAPFDIGEWIDKP
jgi:hypothetical protein